MVAALHAHALGLREVRLDAIRGHEVAARRNTVQIEVAGVIGEPAGRGVALGANQHTRGRLATLVDHDAGDARLGQRNASSPWPPRSTDSV